MSIQAVYTLLCKLKVDHQYFSDGRVRGLSVTPTAHCRQQMNRFHFRYQPTADGFEILYPRAEGTRKTPFVKIDEPLSLGFYLGTNASWFYNVSALIEETATIYYCDNRQADGEDDLTKSLAEGRLLADGDCYPKTWGANLNGRSPVLTDNLGETVSLAASTFVTGVYDVGFDGETSCPTFVADDVIPPEAFAFVNIHLGPGMPGAKDLYDPQTDEVTGQSYRLVIGQRKSYWRYYLLPQGEPFSRTQLSLSDANTISCKFERKRKKLIGGESAYVLTTNKMIPRSELARNRIVLDITRHGNTVDEVELPAPAEDVLTARARAGKAYYSEMIVYL